MLNTEVDETQTLPVRVEGSKEFVAAQLTLLEDYKDIFNRNVNPIAAYIEPFTLVVDEAQWGTPSNSGRARRTDKEKSNILREQTTILCNAGVIRPSTASHYSHGFVVPKPGNKWRFVADYKT